jgi:hypothetical protein
MLQIGPTHRLIIALMMEVPSTSETSVSFHQTTRRNIPEDSNLQEKLKELHSVAPVTQETTFRHHARKLCILINSENWNELGGRI